MFGFVNVAVGSFCGWKIIEMVYGNCMILAVESNAKSTFGSMSTLVVFWLSKCIKHLKIRNLAATSEAILSLRDFLIEIAYFLLIFILGFSRNFGSSICMIWDVSTPRLLGPWALFGFRASLSCCFDFSSLGSKGDYKMYLDAKSQESNFPIFRTILSVPVLQFLGPVFVVVWWWCYSLVVRCFLWQIHCFLGTNLLQFHMLRHANNRFLGQHK